MASKAEPNSLNIYVDAHKRSFDFAVLEAALGLTLGSRVAVGLCEHFRQIARSTAVERFLCFCRYMKWLAESDQLGNFREFVTSTGNIPDASALEAVTHLWFSYYKSNSKIELTTIAECVNHVGRCLDILADKGILPRIVRPHMPRNYHKGAGKRKSFAEISGDDQIAQAKLALKKIMGNAFAADSLDSGESFLSALISSAPTSKLDSARDIITQIQRLNVERLSKVRMIAEEKLIHWRAVFEYGQELRNAERGENEASSNSNGKVVGGQSVLAQLRTVFAARFQSDLKRRIESLFAHYVFEYCAGLCPTEKNFAGGRSFFLVLMRYLGGRNQVKAWFAAHEDAVAAAALIYLIDSGANISVVLGFTLNWEEPCDEPGHVRISGIKGRSGYEPIVDTLPIRDPGVRVSAVEALRIIKRMTDVHRTSAPELSDRLFVHSFFTPSCLNDGVLANRLRYFLRDDPELSKVNLLPSYIRPSVLLQSTLAHDGSILAARAIADHGRAGGVTEGYTMRYPVRLLYELKIREFQEHLHAVIIYGVEVTENTKDVFEGDVGGLLHTAQRTGFGLSCKNPELGIQEGTKAGEVCSKIESCLGCEMNFVHATKENLADLFLFQDHLKSHQSEWQVKREERWNQVWLPYLAFCEVVFEKIRRGPHAATLVSARDLAEKLKMDGYTLSPLF